MFIRSSISVLAILSLWTATSCSTPPKTIDGTPQKSGTETVYILGTNDIHGSLAPIPAKTREEEGTAPVPYTRGGAAILATQIRILRQELGSKLLHLDAGDEFQGSVESNAEEGAPMVQFFNAVGLNAAAVGNHEFDFGPEGPEGTQGDPLGALKKRMSEAKYVYVASNIVKKSNGSMPSFPNMVPHTLLQAGSLKVGVIGLSTLDTPVTTRAAFVRDLAFTDLKEATLREADALRKEGAQIIVITAHVGLKCLPGRAKASHSVRKPNDPQGECGEKDELVRLLKSLPSGTVDAVVAGHSHQVVHHWVAGVPVIQAGTRNQVFNLLSITYDWNQKKVLHEESRIEGPIPVCEQFFKNQKDCDGDRPAPKDGRGPLIQAKFRNKSISPDPAVMALLEPVFARSEVQKKQVLAQAVQPIEHTRTAESPLGNLVSDAIRKSVQTDFALVNSGGLRAPIEAGPITFEALFRTLPFDNSIAVLNVNGKELKNILRVAESGSRGFFPVSGLRLRLIDPQYDAPSNDLDKNGRIDPWEINRLIEAKTLQGQSIRDDHWYTLATIDFLVTGGDDLGWAMSQIPADRVQLAAGGLIRDVVQNYLAELKTVNTAENPLVLPKQPRMTFEKAHKAQKAQKRRRRK